MTGCTFDRGRFFNFLRICLNIDQSELVDKAVLHSADQEGWRSFRRDPFRWLLQVDDATASKVMDIIENRDRLPHAVPTDRALAEWLRGWTAKNVSAPTAVWDLMFDIAARLEARGPTQEARPGAEN